MHQVRCRQRKTRLCPVGGWRIQPVVATLYFCEVLYVWSKFELVEKLARFWELMAQGSTLTASCDAVGVNR